MKKLQTYRVLISKDALLDIKETRQYLLTTFKYPVYADNFSKKIKKAIEELRLFPLSHGKTDFVIRVFKDRMHWQSIIRKLRGLVLL